MLNRHLKGWANYYSIGYPASVNGEIERYRSSIGNAAASGHNGLRKECHGRHIWRGWGSSAYRKPRMPEASAFKRGGRRKSAPPVRRGGEESQFALWLDNTEYGRSTAL